MATRSISPTLPTSVMNLSHCVSTEMSILEVFFCALNLGRGDTLLVFMFERARQRRLGGDVETIV